MIHRRVRFARPVASRTVGGVAWRCKNGSRPCCAYLRPLAPPARSPACFQRHWPHSSYYVAFSYAFESTCVYWRPSTTHIVIQQSIRKSSCIWTRTAPTAHHMYKKYGRVDTVGPAPGSDVIARIRNAIKIRVGLALFRMFVFLRCVFI